ncbi:Major facilitator superfamily domain, general substrate transporter [Akanthomyces lecanii RCEF 1005]|uniref:Major facilitator superfamily domain, general substrate transporter n=1 Tax=Akanthomyces lecanii RCEF 1005 TaxID=1081108 RepID=A0A162MWS6_CORDF|nr:Major facilitator superfamily domain, general substrate transporter [Akanthomyces lecanii RCEF 1005]
MELQHAGKGAATPQPTTAHRTDDTDGDGGGYPDGGFHAWSVVLGAWCAMFPSMGLLNTLAVLEAYLGTHQLREVPRTQSAWIFSCYAFFLYFCGAQVGPVFDAYNVRIVTVTGSVGMVAALVLLSFSTEFYQILLSFGVLGGTSASLLFNPSLAAIGHWFAKRRAFATGVACTAGGIGGIVFPLVILYLAPTVGFPWAMRVIALLCAVVLAVACTMLRKRLPDNKRAGAAIDLVALSDGKFAATTLAIFLVEFAVFIPYTYISSYALHAGMSPQRAYLLNALLNAGAVPGRALPGYVADRFGVFNTMCATSSTCAVFILALWYTAGGDEAAVTAFAVIFGFWSGAAISLTPVCIGQVCRVEDLGKRSGTAFFAASFGTLVGVPAAAAVLERDGGEYGGLIVFGGAFYLSAFVAFLLARGVAGGWTWRRF